MINRAKRSINRDIYMHSRSVPRPAIAAHHNLHKLTKHEVRKSNLISKERLKSVNSDVVVASVILISHSQNISPKLERNKKIQTLKEKKKKSKRLNKKNRSIDDYNSLSSDWYSTDSIVVDWFDRIATQRNIITGMLICMFLHRAIIN